MNIKVKILAIFLTGLILVVMVASCNRPDAAKNNQAGLHITSEAIQLKGGWGYKIEVNNHPFIYQNQIPCIPGDRPFPTKESAMAVAQVMMNKIAKGKLPSISMAELEKVTDIKDN
jgi:hypothetical protein